MRSAICVPAHTDATLHDAQALCEAARLEPDPALYVARNEAFHMSLYAPSRRPQLIELITTLHRRGERYLRVKFGLPDHKGVSDREHAALMRAIRKRDIPTAQKLLSAHLLGTGELLYRLLSESGNENMNASGVAATNADAARKRRAAAPKLLRD